MQNTMSTMTTIQQTAADHIHATDNGDGTVRYYDDATTDKAAAARENGNKGSRPKKGAALKARASEVGLVIDGPIHDNSYWVSGVEKFRSESWIRKEIYRRSTETNESDE